jgi:Replication-relaxation
VLARLHVGAPLLLAQLLEEPLSARGIRARLGRLHDAGLVARADVGLHAARGGRPPTLFAIAPRGLEHLRLRRQQLAAEREPPRYLGPDRKLPAAGRGSEVPHELAVQVTLVALRQYRASLHWRTARMPGGHWNVGMVHKDERDRSLRISDLLPAAGYSVHGEQLDAPPSLEPDLSVQLQSEANGERATIDLLVEVDRTGRGAYNAAKYTAYDQFLGGWCLRTRRFGQERGSRPLVAFVTRRAGGIPALLHAADRAMTLGFGAPGRYPAGRVRVPGARPHGLHLHRVARRR